MANIPLKTIKFPGLDDTYTVPQVDNTLSVTGAAADAKKTGDELSEINERLSDEDNALNAFRGKESILDKATVLSNKYVDGSKALVASGSWDSYQFDCDEYFVSSVSLWSTSNAYYAISFYSTDNFIADNWVGGYKFQSSSAETAQTISDIVVPKTAKYAVVTNRKASSTNIAILGGEQDITGQIYVLNSDIAKTTNDVSGVKQVFRFNQPIDLSAYNWATNKNIDNHGEYISTSGFVASADYIPLSYGVPQHALISSAVNGYIAFYTNEKVFTERLAFSAGENDITVRADTCFIRLTLNADSTTPVSSLKIYTKYFKNISDNIEKIVFNTQASTPFIYEKLENTYIDASGNKVASGSWDSFVFENDNIKPVPVSAQLWSNNAQFYAVAFYDSDVINSQHLLAGSIKFKSSSDATIQTISIDAIPTGTKYIVVANRKGTSEDIVINVSDNNIHQSLIGIQTIIANSLKHGEENVKAIFENVMNDNDFVIIKDEIWFATIIDADTDQTRIRKYKILENGLGHIEDIVTDFGHWNSVDYCEENDCLVFGNGGNSSSTEGNWFAVVPNPTSLTGTVSLASVGIKYSVNVGYKVNAIWGGSNLGENNIVYLISNDGTTFTRVLLKKDSEGLFTGEYVTLDTRERTSQIPMNGTAFWGDTLYICYNLSHSWYEVSDTDLSAKKVQKTFYKADGTAYTGSAQGIWIDSKYLWVFMNTSDSNVRNFLIQYRR